MNDLDACFITEITGFQPNPVRRPCGPTVIFMNHPNLGPIGWCRAHENWAAVGKRIESKEDAIIMSLMQT